MNDIEKLESLRIEINELKDTLKNSKSISEKIQFK